MFGKSVRPIFLLLTLLATALSPRAARADASLEYPAKAAIVYHTTQFTEWPAHAFAGPKAPIVVALVGDDVFRGALEAALKDKTASGRPLLYRHFPHAGAVGDCHVLVVSPAEKDIAAALGKVKGKPVLTISDAPDFLAAGGMMRTFIQDNKPRFELRPKAADAVGLKLSAKLLRLAAKLHDE